MVSSWFFVGAFGWVLVVYLLLKCLQYKRTIRRREQAIRNLYARYSIGDPAGAVKGETQEAKH